MTTAASPDRVTAAPAIIPHSDLRTPHSSPPLPPDLDERELLAEFFNPAVAARHVADHATLSLTQLAAWADRPDIQAEFAAHQRICEIRTALFDAASRATALAALDLLLSSRAGMAPGDMLDPREVKPEICVKTNDTIRLAAATLLREFKRDQRAASRASPRARGARRQVDTPPEAAPSNLPQGGGGRRRRPEGAPASPTSPPATSPAPDHACAPSVSTSDLVGGPPLTSKGASASSTPVSVSPSPARNCSALQSAFRIPKSAFDSPSQSAFRNPKSAIATFVPSSPRPAAHLIARAGAAPAPLRTAVRNPQPRTALGPPAFSHPTSPTPACASSHPTSHFPLPTSPTRSRAPP